MRDLRNTASEPISNQDPLDRIPSNEDFRAAVTRSEMAHQVKELLEDLDPTCKQAITLFYFEGKKYREIADDLGLSVGTICGRMAKCTAKLQKSLRAKRIFSEFFDPAPNKARGSGAPSRQEP